MKFAHIINPVKASSSSDLFVAQPITFESMRVAKEFAEANRRNISIRLLATNYTEDQEIIPHYFEKTKLLERSILDFGHFEKPRKLPLIQDIFDRLENKAADADYLIYTNVDIALMPSFYCYVNEQISKGFDALVINRRTLSDHYSSPEELTYMYADLGKPHPGYDCFVLKKELLPKFVLGKTCIGANWIGRVMIANLLAFASNLKIEKKMHLTFHIGEDGAWLSNQYNDYDSFNKQEAYKVLNNLMALNLKENRKIELKNIVQFMDDWGQKNKLSEKQTYQTLTYRILSKLRNKLTQ